MAALEALCASAVRTRTALELAAVDAAAAVRRRAAALAVGAGHDDLVSRFAADPDESVRAAVVAARTEAIFLDPTYTAKAMAGLIAYVRQQKFKENQTVLFWHTGGQVGLFA